MKKLRNIQNLGRYRHKETGQEVNMKSGIIVGRTSKMYYYLYRNVRQIVPENEYFDNWKKITE
jgi:hypothetical protein